MQRPTKRPKAIYSCASCRKSKTRCEVLDHSSTPIRCHRCKVLSIECSYQDNQAPPAPPPQLTVRPAPQPTSTTVRAPRTRAPEVHRAESPMGRLWSFVPEANDRDWSAPMLGIQHLTTMPVVNNTATPNEIANNADLSLSTIIPEARIDYLIHLFNTHYTPWLNFQPSRNSPNPLVDIACSAVAARHLEGTSGREVRLRLQALAYESIARMIFSASAVDSVEGVQCLLIIALWPPFGASATPAPAETHGWTPRWLIAASVRMARTLRLDHASAVVLDLRKQEYPDRVGIAAAYEQALLWIALTNAESMLCLGTRSEPSSRRSDADRFLVQFPVDLDTHTDLRNLRLGLTTRQFDLCQEGSAMPNAPRRPSAPASPRCVSINIRQIPAQLTPCPVVLEHDQSYFHALHIPLGSARLLLLYHGFWEARRSLPHIPQGQPWHMRFFLPGGEFEQHSTGRPFFYWARDMLQTCEALLVAFLAAPPPPPTTNDTQLQPLSTAPDSYFHMIALAAGYLIGGKFLVGGLLGATDLILAKTAANLRRAAWGPGHAAHRCALLVEFMIGKWRAHHSEPKASPTSTPASQTESDDGIRGLNARVNSFSFGEGGPSRAEAPDYPIVDVEFMFLNSMLADEAAFWDTLTRDELAWC
ncbi:hypothetical protein C8R46DRAFT_883296 [Mycena filopes]|nr:hypothetical protein C8R46DRAFT_883296 [Mycena filopes]